MNSRLQPVDAAGSVTGDPELLVAVEGVSKKYCRDLKRSLWYGVQDIAADWVPWKSGDTRHELRQDEFWALEDVSFELRRGECLGLIGRNGAGKTTLLKMLNGLLRPDKGRIGIRGRVGALISLGAGFNPILTGRENVYVNGSILGLRKKEIDVKFDEIVEFAEVAEFIDTPIQNYSAGMQVRLGFAVAATLTPDVLILDEVLAVGDEAFRVKCFNRITELMANSAVIFVSHNMPQVTRISNRLLLLHQGKMETISHDLGAVVSRYQRLQASSSQPLLQGNGKARIGEVVVADENHNGTDTLIHGRPFSIVIRFKLMPSAPIENLRVMVTISDQNNSNVVQILEPVGVVAGEDNVSVHMDFSEVLFNMGRYSATASVLAGRTGELISVMRNAAIFDVKHQAAGYAPIILHPQNIRTTTSE